MRIPFTIASWIALVMAAVFVTSTRAEALTVTAQANIFGAGHAAPPDPGGGGGGVLPLRFDLSAGANRLLTFSSVVGIVNCCGGFPPVDNGPDGRPTVIDFTHINSFGGISGIVDFDRAMFLTGVFLDNSEPMDPAPARLDFTGAENFAELFPVLHQTFFIGDGLAGTGSGSVQVFRVPDGATRLYLGFADAFFFQNDPGYYDDNTGSLTATFVVTPVSAVPEPSSLMLALLGMTIGTVVYARRRHV